MVQNDTFIFRNTPSDVSVKIDGVTCVTQTAIDTKVVCVTGPHAGSIDTDVEVEVSGNGIAQEVG